MWFCFFFYDGIVVVRTDGFSVLVGEACDCRVNIRVFFYVEGSVFCVLLWWSLFESA